MLGCDALGTAPLGSAGTAAGTSSAAAAGASFTATVQTGRAVGVGQVVEVNETVGAVLGRADGTRPPAAAERLLRWLLPLKVQEPVLGDLAEMYADTSVKFGSREARRLYWRHAVGSIAPVLRQAVMRWSIVATVAEWLRRAFWS